MRSGFTLIELLIALVIVSLVIPIIYEISESVIFSTTTLTATNDIKLINQRLIEDIKTDIVQSALIFDNNSSYKDKISLNTPPNFTTLSGNKLPIIDETGNFPPNPDNVGNVLFIAKYLSPIELAVNGTEYRIDIYRFIYYFLAKDTTYKIKERNPIVLLKAQSRESYIDYLTINNVSDNNKKRALVIALYNSGIRYSVDLKNVKFYELRSNGNLSLLNNYQIQMDAMPALRDFGICQLPTGSVYYAIGYNTEHLNIPKFANADNNGDGFPNGFEVAVIGPKSSRDVLIRTVVISHISGRALGNEKLTIISVPQF